MRRLSDLFTAHARNFTMNSKLLFQLFPHSLVTWNITYSQTYCLQHHSSHEQNIQLRKSKEMYLPPWIMKPKGSMPHSKGLYKKPYVSRIIPIPLIDSYFFKIHSNIDLPSTPRPS